MENLDIIIYTVVVSATFLFFIVSSVRQFKAMGKNEVRAGEAHDPYRRR